jgi:hypothetical protein
MTESKNKSETLYPENDGLALQMFKEECCSNCTCQSESSITPVTDAMGREKFWEDISRP